MSCFLVAVERVQLNLQALAVNKGKMLVFNLFLWRAGIEVQLTFICVFLSFPTVCIACLNLTKKTDPKPETKISGSVQFL